MTYTEFVCKPASVDPAAANLNGGSGGTPIPVSGGVASGTSLSWTGPTQGIVIGDWFTFDTAGIKNRGVVTSAPTFDMGTGRTSCQAAQTDGGAWGGTGKNIIFRGAWADPSMVAGLTSLSVDAAGHPPRLNVLAQDPSTHAQLTYGLAVTVANSATAAVPITIEGYNTAYGDLRGTMTAPAISSNGGSSVFRVAGSYVTVRNIAVSTTGAGVQAFDLSSSAYVNLINCAASSTQGYAVKCGSYARVDNCLITAAGGGSNGAIYASGVSNPTVTRCRFTALNVTCVAAIHLRYCGGAVIDENVFYNFAGDCILMDSNNQPAFSSLKENTAHAISSSAYGTGSFLNAGAFTDLSYLAITDSIFAGLAGKVIYSTAGSNLCLARYAHNIEYGNGGRFSANVLDNSEDIATANPFSGGETLAAAAKSHAILTADGTTCTYPDYGAVQAQAVAAGGMLVHGGMTGGISG
jgi:hypothetical protein